MIALIRKLLGGNPNVQAQSFAEIWQAYQAAAARRDTRAMHELYEPLKAARHAQLRAELGR